VISYGDSSSHHQPDSTTRGQLPSIRFLCFCICKAHSWFSNSGIRAIVARFLTLNESIMCWCVINSFNIAVIRESMTIHIAVSDYVELNSRETCFCDWSCSYNVLFLFDWLRYYVLCNTISPYFYPWSKPLAIQIEVNLTQVTQPSAFATQMTPGLSRLFLLDSNIATGAAATTTMAKPQWLVH